MRRTKNLVDASRTLAPNTAATATLDIRRTREHWLAAGISALRPMFVSVNAALPDVIHASIGFPSTAALSRTRRRVGECWRREASKDGNCQIFISPVLITPVEILDTLAHELVHVVTPDAGHKGQFISVSRKIGLTSGKPTSAHAGPELLEKLERIAKDLGDLPHAALVASDEPRKKQTTRMIKCECPNCGYTARTTQKWIAIGAPICPTCKVELETIDRLNGDSDEDEG